MSSLAAKHRCLILVLDGLGIGAMDDVASVRPQDIGANSLAHALQHTPRDLPSLWALGLGAALHGVDRGPHAQGAWGSSNLGYPGADSYRGHLEIVGADARGIQAELFRDSIDEYMTLLLRHGHSVRPVGNGGLLLVDEAMCVADSLEADPGLNYNVTGSLSVVSFDQIVVVASLVRARARVNRVIAVGGIAISVKNLLASIKTRDGVEGIDTPALGVYRTGVVTRHLGFVGPAGGQLPAIASNAGVKVTLIGKAADLIECEHARRIPAIETGAVFDAMEAALVPSESQLIIANVQQLDLAGHQHAPEMYVDVLSECDRRVEQLLDRFGPGDCVIVTGDHGNDPTRMTGHTRERVPVLMYHPGIQSRAIDQRATLSDVGATACEWLELPPPPNGESFLSSRP